MVIWPGSNRSSSSRLLKVSVQGVPGRQSSSRHPQSWPRSCSGASVWKRKLRRRSVARGPSADGVPAAKVAVTAASAGNGSTGTNASQRPAGASSTSRRTAASASISAAAAKRTGRRWRPAVTRTCSSTAAASMRWSKEANRTGCEPVTPSSGCTVRTVGAGVRKVHSTASGRRSPAAEVVPAAIRTWNSVAIGSRPAAASNRSVSVPTHRQRPGTAGASMTGLSSGAGSRGLPSATSGWLKVTPTCGAKATSPRG